MERKVNKDGSQTWELEKDEAQYIWMALQHFWNWGDKVKGIVRNSLLSEIHTKLSNQVHYLENGIKTDTVRELKSIVANLASDQMDKRTSLGAGNERG